MLLVIGMGIGFMLGFLVTLHSLKKGTIGNLVIVDDPEDGSYLFLEISKPDIEELRTQRIIKLNVVDKGKIPHK